MPYRDLEEEDWDDEEWDDEDQAPTVDCPHCGSEVYEDAQRCPHCGEYLSEEDAPPERKPLWIVIGAAACLYIVYRWIVG
jgi:hypothetical protein